MSVQTFSLSVPASPRYLKAVRAFFQAVLGEVSAGAAAGGSAGGDSWDFVILALDEACSNVLKHRDAGAAGSRLCVEAEVGPASVRFRVDDFCSREDIPRIKPRDLKAVRPGGLGTHFIGEIMDRVEFIEDPEHPGRMALVLEKNICSGEGGSRGELAR
jgi:anti-sigma regulatory factor (Ser/Thr protein kinase)